MNPLQFVRSLARLLQGKPQIPERLGDNLALRTILQRRSVRSFTADRSRQMYLMPSWKLGGWRPARSTCRVGPWGFRCRCLARDFWPPDSFKAQRAVIVMGDLHPVKNW